MEKFLSIEEVNRKEIRRKSLKGSIIAYKKILTISVITFSLSFLPLQFLLISSLYQKTPSVILLLVGMNLLSLFFGIFSLVKKKRAKKEEFELYSEIRYLEGSEVSELGDILHKFEEILLELENTERFPEFIVYDDLKKAIKKMHTINELNKSSKTISNNKNNVIQFRAGKIA